MQSSDKSSNKIRIILADDHTIVRNGLKNLINNHDEMEVIGETDNGHTAVQMAQELIPDVVIMDITMPYLNGIEATKQILFTHPEIRIVALSMHSEKHFIEKVISSGALSYVLKDCAFSELINAIKSVVLGNNYFSSGIPDTFLKNFLNKANYYSNGVELSLREQEVLHLVSEGKNTKEIAYGLNLSTKTVEAHRRKIMNKLKIDNIAGLTKYAIREGITPL